MRILSVVRSPGNFNVNPCVGAASRPRTEFAARRRLLRHNNTMNPYKISVILIISTFLAGCASIGQFNPATGRREFIVIPTSSEVSMGRSVHSEIIKKYPLSENEVKTGRLREIGNKLAAVSDRQDYEYNFYLLDDEKINAFTSPGGRIYMHEGLYDKLKSDDEIAAVLAHEIGHCSAKHVVKKIQASMGYNIISMLILTTLKIEDDERRQAAMASNALMSVIMLGYSRKDEYQSDELGIKYMRLAGYDPDGVLKVFQVLKDNSKGSQAPLILRSHPYLDDRIEKAKIEIGKINSQTDY